MDPSPEGIGLRIYEVRRACGPDPRHEMPQRQFAELLNRKAKELFAEEATRYDSSIVARLERGQRKATVNDITVIALVDPLTRGLLWLGWGSPHQASGADVIMVGGIPVPVASVVDRTTEAAAALAKQREKEKGKPRAKRPRGRGA